MGGLVDWWMCGCADWLYVCMCGLVDGWIGGCADWWMCDVRIGECVDVRIGGLVGWWIS